MNYTGKRHSRREREARAQRRGYGNEDEGEDSDAPVPEVRYQHVEFPEAGNLRLSLENELVVLDPSYATNSIFFQSFHQLAVPTVAEGEVREEQDHYGLPLTIFVVHDALEKPAPITNRMVPTIGCKRHGPFKCNCAGIAALSETLSRLCEEFDAEVIDSVNEVEYDGCAEYVSSAVGLREPPIIVLEQANAELLTTAGGELHPVVDYVRNVAPTVSVAFVVCFETAQFGAVIASLNLPFAPRRRFIGPYSLTAAENPTTFSAAVSDAMEREGRRLRTLLPRCGACNAIKDLGRCFCCSKLVCRNCARKCAVCGPSLDARFCPHCIITVQDSTDTSTRDVCQRCM